MKNNNVLVIPDGQVKPGVPLEHWTWIGKYIVDRKPKTIVNIGDFADMPSLCSYDKGKKSFEGSRYKDDIESVGLANKKLLGPLRAYNKKAAEGHRQRYKPRLVLTLGNHEQRIERVAEFSPELEGMVGYEDLPYQDWEVHEFLKPVEIDGIFYAHYFKNPSSLLGNCVGGTMDSKLKNLGFSFVMGHQQKLQWGQRHLSNGDVHQGLVAGAAYAHEESYLGHQGNHHFRGIVMLHDVEDGNYDLELISLNRLEKMYGGGK